MIIQHRSEPDATYEYRNYGDEKAWAFCRDGEVIRWLNQYEEDMIVSTIGHFTMWELE